MRILLLFTLLFTAINWGNGQSLPLHQIDLKGLTGEHTTLDQVIPKGKKVVLSFWATWCAPCKKELDAITPLYADWQDKYDVTVIAISTDDARTAGRVKSTVLQKKWPFEVYQDIEGQTKQVFNFSSIPFTAVLDSKGNLAYTHIGYKSGDEKKLAEKLSEIE
ncbi:MAG TPA: TlpA disulfide reductase family protein [Membranihabitans sp.]|nr:TlpA disulfide reductase family protein [Membranihabitans sp.]